MATNESDTSSMSLEEMATAASALMPARQFDQGEMADIVRLAMQTLNERQRMAVLLSKFEEMSYIDRKIRVNHETSLRKVWIEVSGLKHPQGP